MSSHHHQHQHQQQQEYHHQRQREHEHEHQPENVFVFPSNNGFDRSIGLSQQEDQIRRENNKLSSFQPNPTQTQTPNENVYETSGMLSEMFNFGPATNTPAEILDYRRSALVGMATDWVQQHQSQHVNADSAASMQLFLTNPPPRSPSPPPAPPPPTVASSSTLHLLLPSPPSLLQPPPPSPSGFHPLGIHHHHPSSNTTNRNPNIWGAQMNNPAEPELGGMIEGQGLSLSLSSSLQQTEEFRNIGGGDHSLFFKSLAGPSHQPILHNLQQPVHMGFESSSSSSSLGVVNVLRSSKYAKAAQELLEEFCSVGRGHLKKTKLPNPNPSSSEGVLTKEPLSPADRIEHQRRKVKLLAMLDEVDRRYNHYCEQMQMVVNSFDMVMGYGAAVPYTALAQKAMSRHFRCLKDAIQAELRQSCELIGEKDPTGSSGLTKGETPRLKMLEHNLRQQRAFHQTMGMMDHSEAWRPQRGLPERSVTILRAWLFEHFLHPYPSDADKHLLARQTGLSRNQVSNWFINARVRLWKPMIEEMYQQESKEDEDEDEDEDDEEEQEEEEDRDKKQTSTSSNNSNLITTTTTTTTTTTRQQQQQQQNEAQNPMPSSSSSVSAPHNNMNAVTASASASTDPKRSAETMSRVAPPHHDTDPSLLAINRRHQPTSNAAQPSSGTPFHHQAFFQAPDEDQHLDPTTMIRFGTTGDVSLTLGLRHTGNNAADKTAAFSLRDFGSC